MLKTNEIKMSKISSLWNTINKIDNLGSKLDELLQGADVDESTAPEAWILYRENSNRMFKNEIFNLIHDGKIIIKHNPLVAVGMYMPYMPMITDNGQVKIVVNATSYCTEEEGKFKISVIDLMGLCQGAYAMYMSILKYSKVSSDFTMRTMIIELHTQLLLKGLTGTPVFSNAANAKYLKYISARFLTTHHFGIEKDIHEMCMRIAKIETDSEKAFISQLVLETPLDDWNSFDGLIRILTSKFIALKGKVSVESMRQRISILLGSGNIFALDYVPYIIALASGYYTNYSIYRSKTIKTELQPYCIAVCQEVLQRL